MWWKSNLSAGIMVTVGHIATGGLEMESFSKEVGALAPALKWFK